MRIAQVAPLFESVPPRLYGGTERVVHYLTEELVSAGHEVTLFAAGDSETSAHLVAPVERALRLDPSCTDEILPHVLMLEHLRRLARRFDIVHFHLEYLHLPLARALGVPHLTTVHGRLDLPALQPFFAQLCDAPLVSISDAQRLPLPSCNWLGTVHHGLPDEAFQPSASSGGFLLFVGRISPEKRVDRAVEIARRCGLPLKVAAKVGALDREYFAGIQHLMHEPFVEYIGEVTQSERDELMRSALALLFPIDWPEPFGLVMIEAMACGTPVVAWDCGSVREIVEPGVTGAIVHDLAEAVEAVAEVARLDRLRCAERAYDRFSARAMTAAYLRLYERLVSRVGITAA